MSSGIAIQARGLGKRYLLGAAGARHNSLRDALVSGAKSLIGANKKTAFKEFWALKDANFDIGHGENVGIVGLNGAGKSTLLKMLSRITEPATGSARIEGRLGALLEVGTGFHGELTGRENVFLYGSILGMRKEEVRAKFDAIVAFSGIENFIDTPVKRYSSGMYVRLAFSVAAHLEPDILLLDEVLAVGDLAFQRKCIEHAKELQKRDATILFVSHNMFSIKTMCDRVIYLRQGQIQFDGSVEGGIELYEKDCRMAALAWTETKPEEWPIFITNCELRDERGAPKTLFEFGERMHVRLHYDTRQTVEDPNFIVAFVRSDGVAACNYSTELDGLNLGQVNGAGYIDLELPPLKLVSEMYTISVIIREKGFQQILCGQMAGTFHVKHDLFNTHFGVFHEPGQWSANETPNAKVAGAKR
ncbi:MAG: ABC transporter ATP-binding protein [Pseudomonadota bacterium]